MPVKVLDSWALMAYFMDQPAAEQVEKILLQGAEKKYQLLLSVIQWGEIFYSVMRAESQRVAEQVGSEITGLPIKLVSVDDDLQLVREAAIYKASCKMSYADCFATALAKAHRAELVTGDLEFRQVEKEIKILWLK